MSDDGKVIPEVVDWDEDNPEYATGLNYDHLVGLLVEAVKEQQKEIKSLKLKMKLKRP